MAVVASQKTVATAGAGAIRLDSSESDASNPGVATFQGNYGSDFWMTVGSTDIYVGGSNAVTSSGSTQGKKVVAGSEFTCHLTGSDQLYAVTASGTSLCDILQIGA